MPFQARCHWCHLPFVRWQEGDWHGWICASARCRQRCSRYAIWRSQGGTSRLLFFPLPKQVEAIQAILSGKHRWILYGGARGGGKSMLLRWIAYMLCLRLPNFQAVLLRRTYAELEKSHMRRMSAEALLLRAIYTPSGTPPTVRFSNGSVLELGHCQDPKDAEKYLSAEYNLVLPDELGTFEEDMILKIGGSARIRSPLFKPCVVASTNPGATWVRDRWISKVVDAERYPGYKPNDYFFIQSLLDDNPYPDEEYEKFLNDQDPDTRAAWREGSWDVFEGQYFKEFKAALHVVRKDIPADVPRIGGLDWGYANRGVHLWAIVEPDGHLHITQEYVFRQTLAEVAAGRILQMTQNGGYQLLASAADPSMWIRTGQSGESIAETMQRVGVALQRANHERVNGWQRVRHWLSLAPDGRPWMTIDPSCVYLLRTLPALIHDDTHPEDLDTTGEDHAADALRYLVMARPAPGVRHRESEFGPDSVGRLFQEARAGSQPSLLGRDAVMT